MIFHGRFRTKQDGLSTDSLRRLKRSTTKRNVASDRQLVSKGGRERGDQTRFLCLLDVSAPSSEVAGVRVSPSPSSMSSSVLLCPSAMATLPLITGLAGIRGGSSVSPAAREHNSINVEVWKKSGQKLSGTISNTAAVAWQNLLSSAQVKQQGRWVVCTA